MLLRIRNEPLVGKFKKPIPGGLSLRIGVVTWCAGVKRQYWPGLNDAVNGKNVFLMVFLLGIREEIVPVFWLSPRNLRSGNKSAIDAKTEACRNADGESDAST